MLSPDRGKRPLCGEIRLEDAVFEFAEDDRERKVSVFFDKDLKGFDDRGCIHFTRNRKNAAGACRRLSTI